ncbi:hypothetical protein [Saccharicrinis sp. 156]|uniref:hypothetical protein n=1 Tax=Saccharicrinis sp. 156 TaxID=3417574 RepID=UPI003D354D6A
MEYLEIINLFISVIVFSVIGYRLSQLFIGSDKLDFFIYNHYKQKGPDNLIIDELTFKEKIKYSVPISIFRVYNYFFGIFTGKISYVRKVEIQNRNASVNIIFIELQIRNKKLFSIKEFDSYNL